MRRTLLLLRHAKSSWEHDVADHERPLAPRGWRDAWAAGRLLAERGVVCDLVLCSTATRARQTWQRAVEGGALTRELRITSEIYEASATDLLRLVHGLADEVRVAMLVGHGPGLPDLAVGLGGPIGHPKFATSGLATLRLTGAWSDAGPGSAELESFDKPRG